MADDKGMLDKAIDLDMSIDDIEDLPSFVTPPTGAYTLDIVSVEKKEIGEHPALEFKFTILQVTEMDPEGLDEGEQPPKEGDQFSLPYMLDNRFGVGTMKELLKPFKEKLGTSNLGELAKQMPGMKILMVLKRTFDKKKDKHYSKAKQVAIL